MGYTVWHNQLRLHVATLMLAGGRTVTQTASACGYSSAPRQCRMAKWVMEHHPEIEVRQ